MSRNKLDAASKNFVKKKNEHCIVLTLSPDQSTIEASGDSVWLKAALENPEVGNLLRDALVNAAEAADPDVVLQHEKYPKKYSRLFACPGSKRWKGVQIRSQLSKYLAFHGFGHNMPSRYGEDDPPEGWPVLVDWSKFKGPSKGCSLAMCTEIILQLMEAQGLNPMDWSAGTDDIPDDDSDMESDVTDEEGLENPNKRKRQMVSNSVVEKIAHIQQQEERHGSVFERRRRNMEEIRSALAAMEDGEIIEEDVNANI